jgi:Transposase
VASFAEPNDIPVVTLKAADRNIKLIRPYLGKAVASGRSQVAAIGMSQEIQRVFIARQSCTDPSKPSQYFLTRKMAVSRSTTLFVGRGFRGRLHQGLHVLPLADENLGQAGLARLLALLAEHGDTAQDPIPVAIETPRGLLVACLRATGRRVHPVNPMAVARYRDRHSIAGRKSDHGDAVVLANVLRTDLHAHRPLPDDSELAQAIAVLARAQQDAVWARTQAHNKLRSHLREYFPGFLAAYADARAASPGPGPMSSWPPLPPRPQPRSSPSPSSAAC